VRSFRSFRELTSDSFPRQTALTIGKFDGVHLGHRAILSRLQEAAQTRLLEPAVFTFTHNPLAQLAPEKCPPAVSSPNQRLELLAEAGVGVTLMVEFDDEFPGHGKIRNLEPEEYVSTVLLGVMRAKYIQVGSNFRFGKEGRGTPELLQRLGKQLDFEVEITGDVSVGGKQVSSSLVRELLSRGEVSDAGTLLGRPVQVRGTVTHGAARGQDLGFPTANLSADFEGLAPVDGVYAGNATVGDSTYQAAISVGGNPTFTPDAPSRVEVYLLDFAEDIYGQTMTVDFIERVRPTTRFNSVDELIAEMNRDVDRVREILAVHEG
jgi:riboflavin kinase/FMN adenylyltransferase